MSSPSTSPRKPGFSGANVDEQLLIIGKIFRSVGISGVIWGSDALLYHGISSLKMVWTVLLFLMNSEMTSFYRTRIFFAAQKPFDSIISLPWTLRQEPFITSKVSNITPHSIYIRRKCLHGWKQTCKQIWRSRYSQRVLSDGNWRIFPFETHMILRVLPTLSR